MLPSAAYGYKPYTATVTEIDTRFKCDCKKISCTNTFSSAETVKKTLPKTEFRVHKSICFKVLSLRLETKKHCLKGDKLGKVMIGNSYK